MVGLALLRVSAVASVSVALVAALGSRRVTVVVAVSRGIVRVLLVLRVGCVVLGVDGLLPDLVGRSWSGGGTSSASDDAASHESFLSFRESIISAIDFEDEEGSADEGVGAAEVHEQVRLDVGKLNGGLSFVDVFVANHASRGVGVRVGDTVPHLRQRVEDLTKSFCLSISVHSHIAIKNTVCVLNITSSVDVKM